MPTLHFDAFSGISGDMTVGALLALGLPLEHLRGELAKVDLHGYHVGAEPRLVNGIAATKFDVHLEGGHHHATASVETGDPAGRGRPALHHHHDHRSYRDIRALLERSGLAAPVKETALRIFSVLAEAEGRVHARPADVVTFHEVGAVDSIVDIVGTAVGVSFLGVAAATVGPLPAGSGIVRSQHGPLPVPPPAVVELLRGFDLRLGDGVGELVTPTGAAIVAALARPVAAPRSLRLAAVGYGAGSRSLEDRPNVLRLILGEADDALEADEILVVETNIDDANPEIYDFVMERLFAAGARDVFLTPIQMKKNRPGTLLSVLCAPADRERVATIVLGETSAIGVRFSSAQRLKLPRQVITVATAYGEVRVKVSRAPDGRTHVAPEYDDCARAARAAAVPLKLVYQAAIDAAK